MLNMGKGCKLILRGFTILKASPQDQCYCQLYCLPPKTAAAAQQNRLPSSTSLSTLTTTNVKHHDRNRMKKAGWLISVPFAYLSMSIWIGKVPGV
jgi:hypothetical protein